MNIRYRDLCLVTKLGKQSFQSYLPFLFRCIKGGITSVQLREKTKTRNELRSLALEFKNFLDPFNVNLIINDDVALAKEIDAAGAHIGQSDGCPIEAREILGPKKIIGLSIETMRELTMANKLNCIDYVAASAVFQSKTKPDCKTWWGLEGLSQFVAYSKHPVMGIGGIHEKNIELLKKIGVCGVAVIGALHDSIDPEKSAKYLASVIFKKEREDKLCLNQ